MKSISLYILPFYCLIASALANNLEDAPKTIDYTILKIKAHEAQSFTQGLLLNKNALIETSGLYRKSFIVEYNAETGLEHKRKRFPNTLFAEGITLFEDELYVLSWRSQTALVLKPENFELIRSIRYQGEGWGLTHDHHHLILSNGSHILSYRDPSDFSIVKTLSVQDKTQRYSNLNELEFAQDMIWANVWKSNHILAIQPETGEVMGIADLTPLVHENSSIPNESVLNGIAYDKEQDAFWVTGKFWPKRYLIRFNWPSLLNKNLTEPSGS